ncbi:cytochrome P450 [Rhodococcus pyridinivorans]|uniref:cytochrome P450 n=1 Tax=Rhodococcus pyridinivorans TaxID=103816 RepID=UPI00110EBDA1|nr:cytochrome P450 [Rhodococcus pyridinivorans]
MRDDLHPDEAITIGAVPRTTLDTASAGFREDPYTCLAELRAYDAVQYDESGVYMVFGYDDVKQVLADRALSSSEAPVLDAPRNQRIKLAGGDDDYLLRPSISKLDPPDHTALRKTLAAPFTPRALRRYESDAAEITASLFAGYGPGDRIEMIDAVGHRLPYQLVCRIFGIPAEDDYSHVLDWARQGLDLLSPFRTVEETRTAMASQVEFAEYLTEIVRWKRDHLGNDILSAFITNDRVDSAVPHDRIAATIHTLFLAGFHTTVNQIGLSVLALLRHPGQWQWLVRNPDSVDQSVEELLRYEPTAQFMIRATVDDYRVGGAVIPAGSQIIPWIASANRDEDMFGPTAGTLDLERSDARKHVAFGYGIHSCLGASLARIELAAVLRELVRLAPDLEPAHGDLEWVSPFIRGVRALEVTL